MAFSALTFVNDGNLRLLQNAGQQWDEGTHYAALIKNAHTPAATNTTYSTISAQICTSSSYAHVALASKTLTRSGLVETMDCADIDFSSSGANTMVGRYCYILEGTAASPQSTDAVIGYIDLNSGGSADVNVNAAIAIASTGVITYTRS